MPSLDSMYVWGPVFLATAFMLSWLFTAFVRHYALGTGMIDRPNERSSHSIPTPRGGGVGIVGSFLLAAVVLALSDFMATKLAIALLGAGALVAALGFADDRRPLPARLRFAGHAAAAAWILWWLGSLPRVPILGVEWDLGILTVLLAGLYIVWSINLFNFMDGIDGIASIEAITVAAGGALVWWLGGGTQEILIPLLFAACVAGFLVWNYPPARIFMGDAGSGFLGLVVATLSLWCGTQASHLFWSWFVLIGCFMVDATTTLVRRVRRGERFHEPHRTHAYQYASRKHASHQRVSLAVGLINLLWLLPMASLVALGWLDGLVGVLLAYAPLVGLAFRYKAGDRRAQLAS